MENGDGAQRQPVLLLFSCFCPQFSPVETASPKYAKFSPVSCRPLGRLMARGSIHCFDVAASIANPLGQGTGLAIIRPAQSRCYSASHGHQQLHHQTSCLPPRCQPHAHLCNGHEPLPINHHLVFEPASLDHRTSNILTSIPIVYTISHCISGPCLGQELGSAQPITRRCPSRQRNH